MRFKTQIKMRQILQYFKDSHHRRHWLGIVMALALTVTSLNLNAELWHVSIWDAKQHAPFDGTVLPVQEVPDWRYLERSEHYVDYHETDPSKIIKISEYDAEVLGHELAHFEWNHEHRNTIITYAVPYAGNYKLDGSGEDSGSHPAVDIKALPGTPVYAVANGIVTKSSWQNSGFGNHIVIEHRNVPSPVSPSQKTDVHSSYSHLSTIFVGEGEIVTKGQVIGEIGDTGTATTPHLHFQLDNDLAPWHPYWPFTYSEYQSKGWSFWDAINNGLNQENVYKYTYNPMRWVQENLDGSAVLAEEPEVEEEEVVEVTVVNEVPEVVEVEEAVEVIDFHEVKAEVPSFVLLGNNEKVTVQLMDQLGELVKDSEFDGRIEVSLSDDSKGKLNRNFLDAEDFNKGEVDLILYGEREGNVRIEFRINESFYESENIAVMPEVKPFARFGVTHDGLFAPGVAERIVVQALDVDGNPTPNFSGGGSIEMSTVMGSGRFEPSTLTASDFHDGQAVVQFYGDGEEDVIVLALYGRAKVESKLLQSKLFSDLSTNHDYYSAVSFLYKKGTVNGYPDGTFKPSQTVSRVEALKFIFAGMDKTTRKGLLASFRDTSNGQWYSDYLATAVSEGIVQGYPDGSFKPTQGVNRVEFLKMLFSTLDVDVDPVVLDDPYRDVDNLSWYAPYVQYAKEKNLFPVSGSRFNPSAPMDRAEVAEVIYRLIVLQRNGDAESYSVLLSAE